MLIDWGDQYPTIRKLSFSNPILPSTEFEPVRNPIVTWQFQPNSGSLLSSRFCRAPICDQWVPWLLARVRKSCLWNFSRITQNHDHALERNPTVRFFDWNNSGLDDTKPMPWRFPGLGPLLRIQLIVVESGNVTHHRVRVESRSTMIASQEWLNLAQLSALLSCHFWKSDGRRTKRHPMQAQRYRIRYWWNTVLFCLLLVLAVWRHLPTTNSQKIMATSLEAMQALHTL